MNEQRIAGLLVVAAAAAIMNPFISSAHAVPGCPSPCLGADKDAFTGGAQHEERGGDLVPGRGGRQTAIRSVPSYMRVEVRYVPTCSGNMVNGDDALCTAALEACAVQGQVRLWVYRREVDTRSAADNPPWRRQVDPPTVCLGAADPVLDPTVAIAAMVQRDFQRVVVLKGNAQVSPRPDTLVNIPTRFSTDAPDSYDIPLTLLGQSVTITATARRWTWHFGDRTTATTTAAGTDGRVEHT